MTIERIGHIVYPTDDMAGAIDFYERLGLRLKFRDGDKWAAFDGGGTTFALEPRDVKGSAAASAHGGGVVAFRVKDLDALAERLRSLYKKPVPAVVVGAHERQLRIEDPSGNVMVLYEPLEKVA